MKANAGLLWSVTLFLTAYFLAPKVQACVASTNYCIASVVPIVDERAPTQTEDGKVVAPLIFFIIVLAAFAYIIYQLIKLLDKVIPPPEKKPDPPPNDVDTNYPSITINPTHGPGPAPATLSKSLTITSNTPSWGTITNYDISALNYRDEVGKFQAPVYYDRFWSVGMKTTTDMVNWQDSHYRIDCYVSSTAGTVQYAYYHYGTNWWNCYYTADYIASNHIAPAWFDLSDGPRQPNQFFRLDPK